LQEALSHSPFSRFFLLTTPTSMSHYETVHKNHDGGSPFESSHHIARAHWYIDRSKFGVRKLYAISSTAEKNHGRKS
jgi:hypothetical protein